MKDLKFINCASRTSGRTGIYYGEEGIRLYITSGGNGDLIITSTSVDYNDSCPYKNISTIISDYDEVIQMRDYLNEWLRQKIES